MMHPPGPVGPDRTLQLPLLQPPYFHVFSIGAGDPRYSSIIAIGEFGFSRDPHGLRLRFGSSLSRCSEDPS